MPRPFAALAVILVALIAVPAAGAARCSHSSAVFSSWGDATAYDLLPNGDFEKGLSGWNVTDEAWVLDENEPWHLHGGDDHHAAALHDGASLTAKIECGNRVIPVVRLFARTLAGTPVISIRVHWKSPHGHLLSSIVGTFRSGSSWDVSPVLAIPAPDAKELRQLTVAVEGGQVAIDDIYIDPFKRV
jgi:hypothetical protein